MVTTKHFRDDVDIDYIKSRLIYIPEDGNLIWKNGIRAGQIAGCDDVTSRKLSLKGKIYVVHRLIWAMVTGGFPEGEIDHISGDPFDNRLCNLRLASRAQNSHNTKPYISNTSGHKDVSWSRVHSKWRVNIDANGRKYLGVYADINEAIAVREEAEQRLFGEYRRNKP